MSPSSSEKNIVCQFKIPQAFVTDNGPQFNSTIFRTFCSELNIKNLYSTPHYPQSNRQVKATNKTLLNALKKKLKRARVKWVDKLLRVLWAYRTISRQPIGATPFTLAFRMEAMIPIEISMSTTKTTVQDQKDNNEKLIRQLDWVDEKRDDTAIRIASYHQKTIAQYNKRARPRFFRPGSLVLRKVFENTTKVKSRKLQANWEGSYIVIKAGYSRACHLQTLDDVSLLHPWNVTYLKQYYQ